MLPPRSPRRQEKGSNDASASLLIHPAFHGGGALLGAIVGGIAFYFAFAYTGNCPCLSLLTSCVPVNSIGRERLDAQWAVFWGAVIGIVIGTGLGEGGRRPTG